MIKAVIIDDEPLARQLVKDYLESHSEIEVAAECADGFEGMKAIQQFQPQLIFLDIQMPKITGFEMLELMDENPSVIFTTAFDEYAIKAFETHAVDYLLKPFSKQRFDAAVEKFLSRPPHTSPEEIRKITDSPVQHPAQSQRIVVKTGNQIRIIAVQDVRYIEAADDYVKIVTADGFHPKKNTMSHYEQTLNANQFVRTHRSFIVNIAGIQRIEPYEKESWLAILKSGEKIPVSKSGYARLKAILGI